MPTLERDRLVFRFPHLGDEASFRLTFQRTLRIPDTDKTYPLPPGLGAFTLRHVEDFVSKLPAETAARGGVLMPIWQAEAMWLSFGARMPFAIKVAAGKINAVTGEPWRAGLNRDPQDYMVAPEQPWLDGFAVEKGVIRQFVAMPLGEGYSAEEQVTGKAEWGGFQVAVTPLTAKAWAHALRRRDERRREREHQRGRNIEIDFLEEPGIMFCLMAAAPGGRMRQSIYPDAFKPEDWDLEQTQRVFVSMLHARDWPAITGEATPSKPPSAKAYTKAGLPWFDYYGADQNALAGAGVLGGLKSVGSLFKAKNGKTLTNSTDVGPSTVVRIDAPRDVVSRF